MRGSASWVPTTMPTRPSAAPTVSCRKTCRAVPSPARPTWGRSGTGMRTAAASPKTKSARRGGGAFAERLPADRKHRKPFLRRSIHAFGFRAARDLARKVQTLLRGIRALPAAPRPRSDRGARIRRARFCDQTTTHRLVCRERAAPGARILGRPVDPNDRAAARRRRRRTLRYAAQSGTRRSHPNLRAERDQHRRRRRRDARRVADVRLPVRKDRLHRRLALTFTSPPPRRGTPYRLLRPGRRAPGKNRPDGRHTPPDAPVRVVPAPVQALWRAAGAASAVR